MTTFNNTNFTEGQINLFHDTMSITNINNIQTASGVAYVHNFATWNINGILILAERELFRYIKKRN